MFSKKERKVNPVLLPLLCAFATILLVLGIVLPLAAEIKHLQMIVQQQDVRIGELEKETWRGRVESLQRAEEDDISIKTKQEKLREVWKRNDVQEKQRWQVKTDYFASFTQCHKYDARTSFSCQSQKTMMYWVRNRDAGEGVGAARGKSPSCRFARGKKHPFNRLLAKQ